MLVFVEYFGENAPMEVPGDVSVGEFKQLLQHATGVPVKDQRIRGIREGFTDRSDVEAVLSDGDTIQLEVVDAEAEEEASRAAVQRLMEEDQAQQDRQRQQQQQQHFQQHSLDAQAHAMLHDGDDDDDMADPAAHFGFADAGNPMHPMHAQHRVASALPDILRSLVRPLPNSSSSSAPVTVDEDSHPDKRARTGVCVDPCLGQSFASILDRELGSLHEFTHALGSIRRMRKPLFIVLYDIHDHASVSLLSVLTQCAESSDMKDFFPKFVNFLCNVRDDGFSSFLEVVQNNQELQQQLLDKVTGQSLGLPLVATVVPRAGASLEVVSVVHSNVTHDMLVAQMLTVVANHAERLEEERDAHAALTTASAHARLREEQDTALEEAMRADAAAAVSRREEEERRQREELEAERQRVEEAQRQQESEQAEARRLQAIGERRSSRASLLEPEPEGTKGNVRIMFRLPSGSRVERRFSASSKLSSAYHFMDVTQEFTEQLKDTDQAKLVLSYPKKSFSLPEHGDKTFQELDITGGVAVFVQMD